MSLSTGIGQIGIIVRDLDATCADTSMTTASAPWEVWEVTPENTPDLLHDGQPIKGPTRTAATWSAM